jgi:hypothetical protein
MIDESVSSIDSEAERLCLLLAEARTEKYWQMRGFRFEKDWLVATFGDRKLNSLRRLAVIGTSFQGDPENLIRIGIQKAHYIRNLKPRGVWVKRAQRMTTVELQKYLKDHSINRIKTVYQANNRIRRLKARLETLQQKVQQTQMEISILEDTWKDATPEDAIGLIHRKTVNQWKRKGLYPECQSSQGIRAS